MRVLLSVGEVFEVIEMVERQLVVDYSGIDNVAVLRFSIIESMRVHGRGFISIKLYA